MWNRRRDPVPRWAAIALMPLVAALMLALSALFGALVLWLKVWPLVSWLAGGF